MSLSRRRLLAGLTAVGGLGSLAGVGTAAYLTDRETLTGSYRTTELALDRSNLDVPLSFESLRYGVPTTQSVEIGLDDDSAAGWLWLRLCGGDTRLSRLLDAELTLVFPDGEETTFPDLGESTGADTESGAIRHGGGGSENVELTLTVTVPETDDAGELAYLRDGPNVVLTLSIHTEGADNNDASDSPWTADCPAGQELSDGPADGDVPVPQNESGETEDPDEPTTPEGGDEPADPDEPNKPGKSAKPGSGNESSSGSGTQGGTQ